MDYQRGEEKTGSREGTCGEKAKMECHLRGSMENKYRSF